MDDNLNNLAAMLNNHQVTDDNGTLTEETTSDETTATQETNTVEETGTAEKSAEENEADPKSDKAQSENGEEPELAEDETGKRYVPEGRFKEVYGKAKQTERELAELKAQLAKGSALMQEVAPKSSKKGTQEEATGQPSKADILELKLTLQQFDPKADENGTPTNPEYSPELDGLGFQIWKANPGMSLLDAGREAIKYAKRFSQGQTQARAEARQIKTIQADHGITGRTVRAGAQTPDPDKMSFEEKEAWLKANGQW